LLCAERHRSLIVGVVVATAYFLSARLGFEVAFTAEQVTTVWAPTGIAQAALLIMGRRLWPAVWLGAFISNATTGAPVWTAAVIASGNTLEAVALTWLLPRTTFDPSLSRVADAARLIGFGAVATTVISATVGVTTLCAAAQQPWDRYVGLWSAWWIGDALGSLVVAPVILTIFRSARDRSTRDWVGSAVLAASALAITELIFSDVLGPTFGRGPLHYVLFPLVILAAVRFGQPATSLMVFSAAALTIINTVGGTGPFAADDVHQGLVLLQAFMGVLAATALLLAAAITERHMTQRRLSAARAVGEALADAPTLEPAATAILRGICDSLGWQFGALWLVSEDGQQLRCVAAWSHGAPSIEGFKQATEHATFDRGRGLPGRVWSDARVVWIEDVVRDGNFPRAAAAARAGLHGGFGLPIRLEGHVLGVFEFFTHRFVAADGHLLDWMSTVGNQVGQFIGRKRLEMSAAGQQQRTRAILDAALDAVIAMDHRGLITDFNPAAERMFGYRRDDVVGMELAQLIIPPELRDQHRQGLARFLQTGKGPFLNRRVETRGYHADGHHFDIEVAITTLSDESGPPRFTGFVRDLTERLRAERERRQAENALRLSDERFRSLAASTNALTLFEQDRDLRYRWVFPQHPDFPNHNIGKTDAELLPPGEGDRLMQLKQAVLDSGVARREEIVVTLQGTAHYYDLTIDPRRDATGVITGVAGVAIDISERKRNEEQLRDSQRQLREADRRKDEFLAMLAHELRNPLAPIRTGLEVLRRAGNERDAVERVRPMMERQIGHMVRLIDDLLEVSRITSGKIHLQKGLGSLREMIEAAIDANRVGLDASGAQLIVELPDEPVFLTVDPTRFVQVLSNLLNNAAKFTDAPGRVTVRATIRPGGAAQDELQVTVSDTGLGIDADLLPRVFELFTQGERLGGRAAGGLGIGLALAQRIMALHGGTIEASSGGRGQGSTFTLRLPLERRVDTGPAQIDPAPHPTGRLLVNRRVLVVDDSSDSVDMLAWLVRSYGGEVRTASDGSTAVNVAHEFAPHIILLDVGMPGIDGYETCRRIRAAEQAGRAFIVAITGWGQDRDKTRAAAAGFDAHITKPADPMVLQQLLANVGGRSSAR
jgi:PAS domain S-box-containing protein